MKKSNNTSKGFTLRTRFLLFVTVLLLVVVSAMGWTVYQVVSVELTKNADFQLQGEAETVAKQVEIMLQTTDSRQFDQNAAFLLAGERKRFLPLNWHLQVGLFAAGAPAISGSSNTVQVNAQLLKQMQKGNSGVLQAQMNGQAMTYAYQFIPERSLLYVAAVPDGEILAPLTNVRNVTLAVMIGALVLGVAGITIFARQIVQPLLTIQAQMIAVANGMLTEKVLPKHRVRELAQVGASVNEMTEQLRSLILHVQAATEEVALSSEALTGRAEQAVGGIQQVAATVQEVASGAMAQAHGTQEMAVRLDAMAGEMRQVVETSQAVGELSHAAARQAEQGNGAVQQAVLQMQAIEQRTERMAEEIERLASRSQQVGQIVEVITDIAAQTHLLALNAAIEAARAGEEGKGFAVVADEVRKLAEQSERSAGQIAALIREIRSDTSGAVEAMREGRLEVNKGMVQITEAGESFGQILQASEAVAVRLADITQASEQMNAHAEDVVNSVQQMTVSSHDAAGQSQFCAAATAEQLAAWEQVVQAVAGLGRLSQTLQAAIGRFQL